MPLLDKPGSEPSRYLHVCSLSSTALSWLSPSGRSSRTRKMDSRSRIESDDWPAVCERRLELLGGVDVTDVTQAGRELVYMA